MEKFVQQIALDVAGRNLYKYVYAKQGDSGSRFVKATILADGKVMEIGSGMTAKFRAEKPDGKAILNPATVNDDGTVTVELTKQTLAADGVVDADIVISSASGEELSTVSFKIEVEKAPSGSLADSKNEMLVLQKLIDDSEAALEKLGNVKDGKDGVSPTVSTAATTGGTKVTITDAKGSHEFVVKDGSDAAVTAENITDALGYTPAAPGDIPVVPAAEIRANTAARHSHKNKAVIDGITGQVTIDKLNAPDHATDLVQYGAFQIAAKQIISQIPTVPDVLPNPNALTIKIGSTTVTYDGSTAETVEIADGSEVEY